MQMTGTMTEHSNAYYWGVIALIALGQVVFGVDFGAVNVALASIAKDLAIAPDVLPWVISTYSLTYAGFLVLGGRTADLYGRRRFCIFGLCIFGGGLLVAILAQNVWMLIAARALEGFGSAFFIPASFSLINVLLPDGPIRHRAFSVFSATQGVAMILGLCGGGILTTAFGWRAVFLINLPLVLAAIALSARFIPAYEKSDGQRGLDVGGAVLITAVAVLALTSLSAMGEFGWTSYQGLGLLCGSAVALAAFLLLERGLANPLVPPSTYRYENFLGADIASVGAMATTGCLFVLLNLFMQRVLHFTAQQSGIGMLPYALAVITAGRFIGHGMSRYPLRPTIIFGFALFVVGTLLFAMMSADRGYVFNVVPASIVAGLGSTLATVLLMALSTAAVPSPVQGVATGVLVTFQQIGLALGVSIGVTVVTASARAGDAPIVAFRHGFLSATAMAVIGLLCVLIFTRKLVAAGKAGPQDAKQVGTA
jgi:MFS family permease